MKVLVVSQYFYPENFRINDLVLELKKRNHEVTVLTGKPNYPQGEYYSGYSFKGNDNEIWNDVEIIRVPLRARKTGAFNLMRNYLSFVWHANKKAKKINKDFDIIYVFEVSPITVALPAIKLKKILNIPVIMNVQDLWPENIVAVTRINNAFIISIVDKLVNYIYKHCDLLLCASPSFVERITKRGIDQSKVKYWPQYSIVSKSNLDSNIFNNGKFNITFTGNIGEAQGIDIAIQAADKLRNENIHWNFIGNGRSKEKMELLVKKLNLESCISFYGFIEENKIPQYLESSDAALLILKPDPIFEMTIPAKLQTYLSCGVPILGCVNGEGKKIIEDAHCGIISQEISVESLVKATKELINLDQQEVNNYKLNAYQYGLNNFNKNTLLNELEDYMEGLK